MRLAILIGVKNYDSLANLPACENDVKLMECIIDETGKYEDKLILSDQTDSDYVKNKIAEFVKKYKANTEIEEVFFYFSGHGAFDNDEFYYVLSDYDESSLHRTTLKNKDIDHYIKSLNPKLAVKVVDACQSGVRYVKQPKDMVIQKVKEESIATFNDCYFMFSSNSDQYSFANDSISFFTESFIKSIINHSNEIIRYNSIAENITDDFKKRNSEQNPYFIVQGDLTHEFSTLKESSKSKLAVNLREITGIVMNNNGNESKEKSSLIENIRKEAELYCRNIEEIQSIFDNIGEFINGFDLSPPYNELYNVTIDFYNTSFESLNNIEDVAKSLLDKQKDYFIKINYTQKEFKVKNDSLASVFGRFNGSSSESDYKIETKTVPSSYVITEQVPFNMVEISLEPKKEFPNLPKMSWLTIFAFSKVDIDIFYSFNVLLEKEWYSYVYGDIKWLLITSKLKDENKLKTEIYNLRNEFKNFMEKEIKSRYEVTDNDDNEKKDEELKEEVSQ